MVDYKYCIFNVERELEYVKLAAMSALISTAVCDTAEERKKAREAAAAANESVEELEEAIQLLDTFANQDAETELRRQVHGYLRLLRKVAKEAQEAADRP